MDKIQIPIIEESVQQLNRKAKVIRISANNNDEKFYSFMDMIFPEELLNRSLDLKVQETKPKEMGKTSIAPANGLSFVSKKDMELIRMSRKQKAQLTHQVLQPMLQNIISKATQISIEQR